jgi:rhodanese-related sulfurtransferase
VEHMQQVGFKNIYQMMDGFSGWEANNLPIQK